MLGQVTEAVLTPFVLTSPEQLGVPKTSHCYQCCYPCTAGELNSILSLTPFGLTGPEQLVIPGARSWLTIYIVTCYPWFCLCTAGESNSTLTPFGLTSDEQLGISETSHG